MPEIISVLQASIDRARQLGQPITPPINRLTSAASAPLSGGSFDELLTKAAAREGIDASLLKAVATAESNLDPTAVSSAGAKYLKQMLNRYGGNVSSALAAYNAGPGTVDAHGGVPPFAETHSYVQKILRTIRGS